MFAKIDELKQRLDALRPLPLGNESIVFLV